MIHGSQNPARPAVLAGCALLGAALALLPAAPAAAQPDWVLGVRIAQAEPSGDAYDAVYGDSLTLFGLQLDARFSGWFLRGAWSEGDTDGELVAVAPDGSLFATGEPVELTVTPVHLSAGWLGGDARPWSFRAGGGFTRVEVEEGSFFFRDSEEGSGFHALAGAAYTLGRFEVGVEALYWQVSDVFPAVGSVVGDPDLEALELMTLLSFRF